MFISRTLAAAILLLCPGWLLAAPASQPARPPNVLILLPDQLRWCEVACYGNRVIRTPHMDQLASGGVRITHAFSNYPVCSPARSILLSGRYARSNGLRGNQDHEADAGRPTNREPTLAETLAKAGYVTGLVGKWHLAPRPQTLGFQESLRTYFRHRYYKQIFSENEEEESVYDGYGPDRETTAGIEFIRRHREHPFLLYLAYGPPHMPVSELPDQYRRMYAAADLPVRENAIRNGALAYDENWFKVYMWDFQYYRHKDTWSRELPAGFNLRDLQALYYGQVTAIDDCVGRVLAALREAGLEENTIVVLTSDHGDLLGSHGLFNKNEQYEEACHIPLVVRFPQRLHPGVVDSQVVSLVDVMPTILELCGVAAPDSVQGTSVARVLTGQAQSVGENAAFIETGKTDGIRTRALSYWRMRRNPGRELLFDPGADPYELHDLNGTPEKRAVRSELRKRVDAWVNRTPKVEPLNVRP